MESRFDPRLQSREYVSRREMTLGERLADERILFLWGPIGEIMVVSGQEVLSNASLLVMRMLELQAKAPDRDIQIKFVGLRPGEKLFEELKHLYANCSGTVHPRILRLTSTPMPMGEVRAGLAKLEEVLHTASPEQLPPRLQMWLRQRSK